MTPLTMIELAGGVGLTLAAAGVWLLRSVAKQGALQRRIAAMHEAAGLDLPTQGGGGGLFGAVARLGGVLSRSGLLPASTLSELEHTLVSAGLRQDSALTLFIGSKLLLFLLLPPLAYVLLHSFTLASPVRALGLGASATLGLLLPDFIVRRARARYLKAVSQGLPDALDMLVICSEAGLGLEMGLERVASEIEPAHPAVAAELKLTSAELRILADRRTALTNMGTRTGLDVLKRLAATLIQTMQYGTPLSHALRTLATEMRFDMLMKFEAQAARLPVLLTVPMILFILPCIFIVVGGPAGLTVVRTLLH